jgi:membrane protease YdiL (CAAX protease family)
LSHGDGSQAMTQRHRPLLPFFVLVFALSVPFWLVGAVTGVDLVPGLPVGALQAVCPLLAASILLYREDGMPGVIRLLRRGFDIHRISPKAWYVPILLLQPAVMVASYGVMRWLGMALPTPRFSVVTALALFLAFFPFALAEEVGWMGYATDPMQLRFNALLASVLLGIFLAAWHLVPLVQAQRAPSWIAGWCLSTVVLRVLTVWLYNNTGQSVFAAVLFHDMGNVSWLLFPNEGSSYDPRITGPILAVVAAVVTVIWGPRTLARFRYA